MDGCPFRFAFRSGFNLPAKVSDIAMNSNISLAAICLTVDIIWFDLCKLERESIK